MADGGWSGEMMLPVLREFGYHLMMMWMSKWLLFGKRLSQHFK